MGPKRNIYVIYASQDKDLAHDLLRHFQLMEKDFNVSIWHDKPIYPKQQWKPENVSRLDQADIFLLLVSNAFMYSPFIQQDEFKMVIDKYKDGKATVIPILFDDCPWDTEFNSDDYDFSFKELQVLPEDRRPMRNWDVLDDAVLHVTAHVKRLIAPASEKFDSELPNENLEKEDRSSVKETQTALNLAEDSAVKSTDELEKEAKEKDTNKIAEEVKDLEDEAEVKRKALETKKRDEEVETKRKMEEALTLKTEAKK
ncbi:TIR domain-containing protein, partial [Maribacter sp.]|nr:TIR domain-containing protein [Maribacter sp.]